MLVPVRYALAVITAGVILAGCSAAPAPQPSPSTPAAGTLKDAVAGCTLTDGAQFNTAGTTLTLDTKGPNETAGASLANVKCVLDALNVPANIQSMMKLSTSASDQHSASWEGRQLSWSYDPGTGFNLTITGS